MDSIVAIPLQGQPMVPGGAENSPPALPEFLAGPENRLVAAAVRSVLEEPTRGYDPLVFCGPSGTGKSHVARGMAAQWRARHRRSGVLCTTAADFGRELAEAIETQALDEFRNRYRMAALLVLEDIDRLAGVDDVQWELVQTFDALLATGRRVVVTAVATPARLPCFTPRLQSRLTSGLTVSLAPPASGTRSAVLQRLARLRDVKLSASAAQMLAEGLPMTVPELFGVLAELETQARLHGGRIDAGAARSFLALRTGWGRAPLRDIAATTAQSFALRASELRGPSRRQAVVTARAVAMYLARRLTSKSLERIGHYFGGRDHTTVMYGCRKTEKLLKTDPAVSQVVQKLLEKLLNA